MAREIKRVKIEELIPYATNSRTHSDEQISQVAASIKEFGWTNPILVDEDSIIIAGHGRVLAARKLGESEVPCIILDGLTQAQKKAYVIADNKLALNAEWDNEMLRVEIDGLKEMEFDIDVLGFSLDELNALIPEEIEEGLTDENAVPEVPDDPATVEGDVWILGNHRLMCGDSTSIDAVEKLMDGQKAQLIHADPPYGMGKEKDGVLNDNIYKDELDEFQMEWWTTFRIFTEDNGSAYIWGNAPDLWRLWYKRLGDTEKLELRNQIVWDKKAIPGMKSDLLTQYPIASEHCLFFQIGQQFIGNINADEFPESWESIRGYMAGEAKSAGITSKDIKRVCGCQMFSHWFTKSQFCLISKKNYNLLASSYSGHFLKPWDELKREWDVVRGAISSEFNQGRSYFDNAHDVMRDVWEFSRVSGDERHGHATPKPVDMMERIMKSSLPKGGVCAEPFGGSGSTLMGAEKTSRKCYTMELDPKYCDVIIKRWQDFKGRSAVLEKTGEKFDETS